MHRLLAAALALSCPAHSAQLSVQAVPSAPRGLNAPLVLQPGLSPGPGAMGAPLTGSLLGTSLPNSWSPAAAAVQPLVQAGPVPALQPGAWLPENRRRLETLLREHGREERPLAVFDWDNTIIRNDIGEALFYHAIREMRFKFELGDAFWDVIPEAVGREDIRASYEAIRHLPPEQAKKTPEYRRYRKLFHLAYEGVKTRKELGVDFGWLVQLMQGFTVAELEALTDEVIAFESARLLGEEEVSLGDGDAEPLRIRSGIRFYGEMKDLLASLMDAGWDVRIVSATAEWAVARIAALAGVPRENVHGVLVRVEDGKLTGDVTQRTWDQGKADVILEKTGRRPLLAAGDSNFDLPMLRLSAGERIVIDLGKEPIGSTARREGWIVQPAFPAK